MSDSGDTLSIHLNHPTFELLLIFTLSFFISRAIRKTISAAGQRETLKWTTHTRIHNDPNKVRDKIIHMCVHKFEKALDVFNEAKSLNSLPRDTDLHNVMRALSIAAVRFGKPDHVFDIIRSCEQLGARLDCSLAKAIIKSCTSRNYNKECLALYDLLFDRFSQDEESKSCLLFSAVEIGEHWRCRRLFMKLTAPSSRDITNFMRSCCARGDVDTAVKLYGEIDEPSPATVQEIARCCLLAGRVHDAECILGRDGGRLDSFGFNNILTMLALLARVEACEQLLRSSRNFPLSRDTVAALRTAFTRSSSLFPERISSDCDVGYQAVTNPISTSLEVFDADIPRSVLRQSSN